MKIDLGRWWPVGFGVAIPCYLVFVSQVRPLTQTIWPNDTLMLADFGARLLEGLAPHTDYFAPLGILTAAISAAGLYFSEMKIEGLYLAIEVVAGVLAFVTLLLARAWRVPAVTAIFLGYLSLEYLVSLRVLAFPSNFLSLAGYYNRVGWVLLTLQFLATVSWLERPGGWFRGAIIGILLSLSLATKLTFWIAGVTLIAPLLTAGRVSIRTLLIAAAAFVMTSVVWFWGFGIGLGDFTRDQMTMLNAMPFDLKMANLTRVISRNYLEVGITFAFVVFWWVISVRRGRWRAANTGLCLYLCAVSASVVAGVGSMSPAEFLLSFVSPLSVLTLRTPTNKRVLSVSATLLVIFLSWPTLRDNWASLRYRRELVAQINNADIFQHVDSSRADALHFATWPNQVGVATIDRVARERRIETSPAAYAYQLNRALDLLRNRNLDGKSLLSLNWDQSLAYLSGARHVRGDALLYHVGRVNSVPLPTDVESVVRRADFAITPRGLPNWGQLDVIEIYLPLVRRHMTLIAENDFWQLWAQSKTSAD